MTFWAAIIGALIGGFIALTAQVISFRFQMIEGAQERRRESRLLGYSMLFKLQQTVKVLEAILLHVEKHYSEPEVSSLAGALRAYEGPFESFDLTANEFALLAIWEETGLISSIQKLARRYRDEIELIKFYNDERTALSHMVSQDILFSKHAHALSQRQKSLIMPCISNLDSTLDTFNRRLPATLDFAKARQKELTAAVEKRLQIRLEARERRVKVKRVRRTSRSSTANVTQQSAKV